MFKFLKRNRTPKTIKIRPKAILPLLFILLPPPCNGCEKPDPRLMCIHDFSK
jgi:hypothetical protein